MKPWLRRSGTGGSQLKGCFPVYEGSWVRSRVQDVTVKQHRCTMDGGGMLCLCTCETDKLWVPLYPFVRGVGITGIKVYSRVLVVFVFGGDVD